MARFIALCPLLGMAFAPVGASELAITAEFVPSASAPNNTKFVNTTPLSGYCHGNNSHCRPGDFTVMFALTIQREWVNPGPIEGHNYQRVDGDWKTVHVDGDINLQSVPLRFRLNLLARRYQLGTLAPGGVGGGIGRIANASGISGSSQGGCRGRVGAGHSTQYSFAWGVPLGMVTCARGPTLDPLGPYTGTVNQVSVGYELETPNPFALPNGIYRGSVTYTVGQGQQIDLGTGTYNDSHVTFNFELKVQHELRVDFAANSDRVMLEPDGGWVQWLHGGSAPTRLSRVHPFQIWASAPLKMYLRCDEPMGNQCSIREPHSNHQVPIVVAVSLPGTLVHNGTAVQALPLPVGEGQAFRFESVAITAARQGRLHYSVEAPHVAAMMRNTGRQYSGDVTIVFDAQM
ncbi:hypothetical protein PMM47T1_13595 [Pseudomonas sp. M47T1]|uniref:hypothetical protein n=1 Tax=unclassified Pseudomonas TaxID=196821 RepID=UPI00026082FD|nr:hypothetical protein [Pseudomonas sp. M47T1]EIK95997.1 hypothetical protein PMM47T1_13595 [Pseudomonas sp. M47T1]